MNVKRIVIILVSCALVFTFAIAGLTSCSQDSKNIEDTDSQENSLELNLYEPQVNQILNSTKEVLNSSFKKKSLLKERFNGQALDLAKNYIDQNKKKSESKRDTLFQTTIKEYLPPRSLSWPRTLIVFTEINQDKGSQNLLFFVQDDAYSQYKLSSITRIFPEVEFPKFGDETFGSNIISPTSTTLIQSPSDIFTDYLSILGNKKTDMSVVFEKDPLLSELRKMESVVGKELKKLKGTQTLSYLLDNSSIIGLESYEKGGLVKASYNLTWNRHSKSSNKLLLPIDDDERRLFGKQAKKSKIEAKYDIEVVAYIPPQNSNKKIEIVAAELFPKSVKSKS